MPEDIAAVVDAARLRAFVGRSDEVACFQAALCRETDHRVLFVHGVGGLGKTALLHQFRILAQSSGLAVSSVDSEDAGASPETLQAAVDAARASAWSSADDDNRGVLLIDGYERLSRLDDWVRDHLVASLPADTVVVIAGRDAPSPVWRTDPGWRSVVASLPLAPLDPPESRQLLAHAGVSADGQGRLAALGRGHPLTLAMLAGAVRAGVLPEDLTDAPDLVAALATRLVDEAPDDDHALAMALCAHAWLTTQDLVDHLLGRSAPEVWAWLETRPWVTRGTYGSYPHDLVRDVLDADLRRRSPATYRRVHNFVHEHAWSALRSTDEVERRLWAHQKLFLHRRSPLAAAFWTLRTTGAILVSAARPDEHAGVIALVERSQGEQSARLARRWIAAQPENLSVVRSASGLDGFVFHAICPAAGLPPSDDVVTRAALDYAAANSPARPGEQISVARFLGGRDGDQSDPYAVVAGSVSSTLLWTTQPLAWSFVALTDPTFWGPVFDYLAFTTVGEADYEGLRHTLYAMDWRRLTAERWFELMGERELTGDAGPAPARLLRPAPLSRPSFDAAVRGALRELHRTDVLSTNPLIGSRLALEPDGSSPQRLQASLVAGIDQICAEPRTAHLGRVLDRTYVHAAPTQEAAAEVLDLPFSTYRRHLGRALERLVDLLWSVEIGELRLPSTGRAGEQEVSIDRAVR